MKISKVLKVPLTISVAIMCSSMLFANEVNPSNNAEKTLSGKSALINKGSLKSAQQEDDKAVEGEEVLSTSSPIAATAKPNRISTITQKPDVKLLESGTSNTKNTDEKKEQTKHKNVQSKNDTNTTYSDRVSPETNTTKSHDFSIYNAQTYLRKDIDGDGYYSEFEVVFDADTSYYSADVYGVLYVSRNGQPWEFYYETDVFRINGNDSDDEYSVVTALNFNFPSDEYNILIDLYEYGYSGIVATLSSSDDYDLFALPLEDRSYESSYSTGFDIYDVSTDLLVDRDGDGYYSEFSMEIDIDTNYSNSLVYAEIYFLNEYNEWELEFTSSDIALSSNSSNDSLEVDFNWQSGYPAGRYDFKVVVIDAYSQQRLFETGRNYNGLNSIPLESADIDSQSNTQPAVYFSSSSSYGSGGGSLGVLMFSLLCISLLLRGGIGEVLRKRMSKQTL